MTLSLSYYATTGMTVYFASSVIAYFDLNYNIDSQYVDFFSSQSYGVCPYDLSSVCHLELYSLSYSIY